jgi:hypothetical protein
VAFHVPTLQGAFRSIRQVGAARFNNFWPAFDLGRRNAVVARGFADSGRLE